MNDEKTASDSEVETVEGEVIDTRTIPEQEDGFRKAIENDLHFRNLDGGEYKLIRVDDDSNEDETPLQDETTQSLHETGRFPIEITDALDVLGSEETRRVLADLCDTHLLETNQSEERIRHLDELVTAGLARKKVHSQTEDTINGRYELSEYGERFIHQLFETLGTVNPEQSEENDES